MTHFARAGLTALIAAFAPLSMAHAQCGASSGLIKNGSYRFGVEVTCAIVKKAYVVTSVTLSNAVGPKLTLTGPNDHSGGSWTVGPVSEGTRTTKPVSYRTSPRSNEVLMPVYKWKGQVFLGTAVCHVDEGKCFFEH